MAATGDPYPPIRVRVLGSGTSSGVPLINCDCPVCTSSDPRNQRMRASVKVEAGGRAIVIDCGVDFRRQMLTWPTPRLDAVLLTHTHADHVHGIDDLRAFTLRDGRAIPIYSSAPFLEDVRRRFAYCFEPVPVGGAVPLLELREVRAGEAFEIEGLSVLPIEILHGSLPILGFRFGRFAYLTDCSAIPPAARAALAGVETIILSALRDRPHPTHFTIDQALEAARSLGVRRVYFIHMAHTVDHAAREAALPDWARLTHDGMELVIP
jgi:phosphoribosyl 1,2-cyclic phosphate phosphodiesterase